MSASCDPGTGGARCVHSAHPCNKVRQKGLRSHRWNIGSEAKRERYRARARVLLAGEDFACVIAQLEHQYWRTGHLIQQHLRPIPASNTRH